jgi:hypothetical protein
MKTPFHKAVAQKNSDGSYTVRVIHDGVNGRSTDVVFPMDSENERLALEYAKFKNDQSRSGPKSPATQAVVSDMKGMLNNDRHEQLMEKAVLEPQTTAAATVETPKKVSGLEKYREEQRLKKLQKAQETPEVPSEPAKE